MTKEIRCIYQKIPIFTKDCSQFHYLVLNESNMSSVAVYRKVFMSIFITLEVITFVLSVLGNLAIIYVILSRKRLARKSNKYILSVSVADFLVGVYVIPFGVVKVSLRIICCCNRCLKDSRLYRLSTLFLATTISVFTCQLSGYTFTQQH